MKKICSDKLIVWGDIHGSLDSLNALKNIENSPIFDGVNVFLGDYADRGKYGIEVISKVNDLISDYPDKYIGLMGNHESYVDEYGSHMSSFDLGSQVELRLNLPWIKYYAKTFGPFKEKLYSAAIAEIGDKKYLLVHGGVCKEIRSIEDIESGKYDDDIFWNDPMDGIGQHFNFRGKGKMFGNNITDCVCESLGIEAIIRSHDPALSKNNPGTMHNGKIINISSTSEYRGKPYVLAIDGKEMKGLDFLGNELSIEKINPRF